jgi:anti-sigma B factor antagonist
MPPLNLVEAPVMHRPDLVTLKLEGTLDIATLPQFEAALNRLREANKFKVLVDLSLLDYISSSGLGSFLGMVDHFRKAGGDLAFVRLTDRVQKIFKVVGFYRLLTILPGEDERVPVGEVLAVLATASLVPERAGHPDQVVKVLASHVRSVTAQPGRDYGEPGGAFYFIHERPLAVLAQRAALQLFEVIKNPDLTPEIDTLDAPTTCALVDGPVGEDGAPTSSAVRPLTDLPPGDQPFDPEKLVWSFEGTRPGCEFTESGRLVRIPELLPWGVIGQNHVRSVYWAVGDLTVHFAT